MAISEDDGTRVIMDTLSGAKICVLAGSAPIFSDSKNIQCSLNWSPNSNRVVSAYSLHSGGEIRCWDAHSGKVVWHQPYPHLTEFSTLQAEYSDDGRKVVGVTNPQAIFSADTGKSSPFFDTEDYGFITLSPDGKLVACDYPASQHGRAEVRELATGQLIWSHPLEEVNSFQWSNQGVLLVSGHSKNLDQALLWDSKTRKILPLPPGQISSILLSVDAPILTFAQPGAFHSTVVKAWNFRTQSLLWSHSLDSSAAVCSWSPDGQRLAVAELENGWPIPLDIVILDDQGELRSRTVEESQGRTAWLSDSHHLATVGNEGVKIWTVK